MRDCWREKVDGYIEQFCIDPQVLEGAFVWLGRSAAGAAGDLADELSEVLEHAGAIVGACVSGTPGLISGPELDRIDDTDAILMLGETPGVTAEALDFCRDDLWKKPIRPRMHVLMPREHSDGYMHARLHELGAKFDFYSPSQATEGGLALIGLSRVISLYRTRKLEKHAKPQPIPLIGIVTALPLEFEAVKRAIPGGRTVTIRKRGTGLRFYVHMTVSAQGGGEHQVVLVNAGMGNTKAVSAAKQLMNDYPSVEDVIMVGIAAGVPNLANAKLDVRLGDVVVSNDKGVVKYDMKKVTSKGETRNHDPRPPSHDWLLAARMLAMDEVACAAAWTEAAAIRGGRPSTDELIDVAEPEGAAPLARPDDPDRTAGVPRVFFGPIGSADTVVKSAEFRDLISGQTDIMAIEMEGSGIAEAMWQGGGGYLIVRGVCDYANDAKNKEWQPYAAAAAASFTRQLIGSMPVEDAGG